VRAGVWWLRGAACGVLPQELVGRVPEILVDELAGDEWRAAGVVRSWSMWRRSCCMRVDASTFGSAGTRSSPGTRMTHDGGLRCAVQTLHEAVGFHVLGGRPAEVDTTQLRQAVEKLRLELASLVGRDCLWTPKACYPARDQGA